MISQPTTNPHSLIGIELARFACTLPILLWHYQHFYYVNGQPVGFETTAQPLYAWLQPFYLYGYLSVQAFWCLSGFIFFWKYAQPVQRGGATLYVAGTVWFQPVFGANGVYYRVVPAP